MTLINDLLNALLKAKVDIPTLEKRKNVDMTLKSGRRVKYDHADLCTDIQEIVDPILLKHGISYLQPLDITDHGLPTIRTIIFHSSGQHLEYVFPILTSPEITAQDIGGTITYFRRYALVSILGLRIKDQDPDGHPSATIEDRTNKPAVMNQKPNEPLPNHAPQGKRGISESQGKRLWSIFKAANWTAGSSVIALNKAYGIKEDSLNKMIMSLDRQSYDEICKFVEQGGKVDDLIKSKVGPGNQSTLR